MGIVPEIQTLERPCQPLQKHEQLGVLRSRGISYTCSIDYSHISEWNKRYIHVLMYWLKLWFDRDGDDGLVVNDS